MTLDFRYRAYQRKDPDGKLAQINLPVAVVALVHGPIQKTFEMLVDSGAEVSLIPKFAGDLLGLLIHEGEPIHTVGGVGGTVPVVYRRLQMRLGALQFPAEVGWVLNDDVPLILGRKDIFHKFRIEFHESRLLVRFHPI